MRLRVFELLIFTASLSVVFEPPKCLPQEPPTIQAQLASYGVPATQLRLQLALRDNRPEVRGLAAGELAEMKDKSSTPQIAKALEEEKDPAVRFNMATSLFSLDSPVGKNELSRMCDEISVPEEQRLNAASILVDTGDTSCVGSVEHILQKTTDPSKKVSALLILKRIKAIPDWLMIKIHTTLLATLQNPVSAVRQYAGECIAALGDKSAIPNLETAIAIEPDELTRHHIEESLKILKGKP